MGKVLVVVVMLVVDFIIHQHANGRCTGIVELSISGRTNEGNQKADGYRKTGPQEYVDDIHVGDDLVHQMNFYAPA
jgi:hypothetical protein